MEIKEALISWFQHTLLGIIFIVLLPLLIPYFLGKIFLIIMDSMENDRRQWVR